MCYRDNTWKEWFYPFAGTVLLIPVTVGIFTIFPSYKEPKVVCIEQVASASTYNGSTLTDEKFKQILEYCSKAKESQ